MGFFDKIKKIGIFNGFSQLDDDFYDELEESLVMADMGADTTMEAPEGFVYVAVKTGVSDDDYTQIVSGIQEGDTIGYDPNSVSSDSYYDDGSGMMIF